MIRPAGAITLTAVAAACLPAVALGAATGAGGASADPAPGAANPAPAKAAPVRAAPAPVARPVVDAITCRSSCTGIATAKRGSVVQVSGSGMDQVAYVVFLGRRGSRDDVTVAAKPVGPAAALTALPARARTGPVRVITGSHTRSLASRRTLRVARAGAAMRSGRALETRADTRRVFADGAHPASVSFFVRSPSPLSVAVDLVHAGDNAVVGHWDLPGLQPGSVNSVTWDGKIAGAVAPEGRYVWRVLSADQAAARASASGAGGTTATSAQAKAPSGPSFLLVSHQFPIAGPHQYGLGAGRFGAQRNGHIHQGQDVFASCGTPLVAVTSGTIKFAGYQGNAGNYLVLAGADGNDYAYMHLKDKVTLKKGAAIAIGQPVGRVGDTGDAVGCHLHFEIWPAPGWYTGGSPIDPLNSLRAWDGLGPEPAATASRRR